MARSGEERILSTDSDRNSITYCVLRGAVLLLQKVSKTWIAGHSRPLYPSIAPGVEDLFKACQVGRGAQV